MNTNDNNSHTKGIGEEIKKYVLEEAQHKRTKDGSFNKRVRDRQKIGKLQTMLFENDKWMRKMKHPDINPKALKRTMFQLNCVDSLDGIQKDCNDLKKGLIWSREKMNTKVSGLVDKIDRLDTKARNYQINMENDIDEK